MFLKGGGGKKHGAWVQIKVYLQIQVVGLIWPEGYVFLTPLRGSVLRVLHT